MSPLTLIWHCDPGHEWLEIPKVLMPAQLLSEISACSYQNETSFFLEGDCDAGVIIEHFKTCDIDYTFVTKEHRGDAFIRRLDRIGA